MREDILEQLVDDYLQMRGYFTRHNLKFRPRSDHLNFDKKQDSNHSDVDVIAVNPTLRGTEHVVVVSCKSWQAGFNVQTKLREIKNNDVRSGRESWRFFRELVSPKWSEAFINAVQEATGSRRFVYVTAVTALKGDRSAWEMHEPFRRALEGNPIRLITMQDMVSDVLSRLGTTVVPSQLGRTLQLLKASGITLGV